MFLNGTFNKYLLIIVNFNDKKRKEIQEEKENIKK